jgi:hypothetical protein
VTLDLSITMNGARREILRRSLAPDLNDAARELALFGKKSKIAGVYRTLRRQEAKAFRLATLGESRSAPGREDQPFQKLCADVTDWLAAQFPMADEPTYSVWTDDSDCNTFIWLENPGVDLSWDDVAELISDPAMWNTDFGLMAFWVFAVNYLDFVADDQTQNIFWDQASTHFGWGVEMPWWLWLPNQLWLVDWKKLQRLLSRCGLEDVAWTYRMVYHDTGNFFLDLETNSEAYGYDNEFMQDFNVENVKRLSEAWKQARPLCDRGFGVSADADEHPERYYPKLIELMGRCIVPNKRETGKMARRKLRAMAEENKRNCGAEEGENEESESEDNHEDQT